LSIDPSNTRTVCHSWVVPPPEYQNITLGNVAIAEWELVARRYTATMLATEIERRIGGLNYEAFVMDKMAGRQTHAGREENTFGVYERAFKIAKIRSRQTLYSFLPGCAVRQVRYRTVRDLLVPQPAIELPSLMFVEEKNLETKKEFGKYRKKTEKLGEGMDNVLDEPANPRIYDAMASVEYFSAMIEPLFQMNQAYVDPASYTSKGSPAYRYAQKILERRQAKEGMSDVVHLGQGNYISPEDTEGSPLIGTD